MISSRSNSKSQNINLLPEEKIFYELIKENLDLSRKNILINLLECQLPSLNIKPKDIKMDNKAENKQEMVRILHPMPKFIGPNEQIYGPLEEESILNIPNSLAQVLIKSKRAEKI